MLKNIPSSATISGIPAIHYGSHLHNFGNYYAEKHKEWYTSFCKFCLSYLSTRPEDSPKYVFFCGIPGNGKSSAMIGLYRALVAKLGYIQGDGACFSTYPVLAQEMIGNFKEGIPLRKGMEAYLQSSWLFLDDITSTERIFRENSLEHIMMQDILVDRYERNTCLVVSCNLDKSNLMTNLRNLFGAYIISRLNDCKIIEFPKHDFRK